MLAIPAVNLREGHVVQLIGGEYDREQMRLADPRRVLRGWATAGFSRVQVVDLDAAAGRGSNNEVIRQVLFDAPTSLQIGGGVRTDEDVASLLSGGAVAVLLGTRAIEDLDWLAEMSHQYAGNCILAVDVHDRTVITRGGTTEPSRDVMDIIDEVSALPLAGLLITAVHKAGRMLGGDLPLMAGVVEASPFPVIASGGIGSMGDVRALEDRGAAGAVVGMALYAGAIDPRALADEFFE